MAALFEICVFGTSLTTNFENRNWPIYLRNLLQTGKRSSVRVHAVGMGGQTSTWGLANIQTNVITRKPNVVLIEFINDALTAIQEGTGNGSMTPTISGNNFRAMIDAVRAGSPGTHIIIMSMLRPRAEGEAPNGSHPNVGSKYYSILPGIAAEKSVPYIDCYTAAGDPALHLEEWPAGEYIHPLLPYYLRVPVPLIAASVGPLIT